MDSQNTARKASTRAKAVTNFAQEMGKIPPQSVELEQIVLGSMMLERNAVNDTIDVLSEQSFYDPKHQYIYKAIRELFASTSPVDLVTVTEKLSKSGELMAAGGAGYVSQLTNRVGTTAHVQYHARIIAEKFIKRELIRVSSEIIKDAYDETVDVFDLLNSAESGLFQIGENNMSKQVNSMSKVVKDAIEEIEVARNNGDGISGVPSGFVEIDRLTSGWQRSDMIVIAARPGMGKTAFVLSAARNTAVQYGMGVAIFSLEMSSVQLVKRLIAGEARIDSEKLRKGDLAEHEFQQLHSRIPKLATAPIFIDDTAAISVFDFRAKCRRLKAQHDIQLIIIDYLQRFGTLALDKVMTALESKLGAKLAGKFDTKILDKIKNYAVGKAKGFSVAQTRPMFCKVPNSSECKTFDSVLTTAESLGLLVSIGKEGKEALKQGLKSKDAAGYTELGKKGTETIEKGVEFFSDKNNQQNLRGVKAVGAAARG